MQSESWGVVKIQSERGCCLLMQSVRRVQVVMQSERGRLCRC